MRRGKKDTYPIGSYNRYPRRCQESMSLPSPRKCYYIQKFPEQSIGRGTEKSRRGNIECQQCQQRGVHLIPEASRTVEWKGGGEEGHGERGVFGVDSRDVRPGLGICFSKFQ